jgi:hypothetical protein
MKAEPWEWVARGGKYVLNQLVVMEPYVDKHLEEIRAAHDG